MLTRRKKKWGALWQKVKMTWCQTASEHQRTQCSHSRASAPPPPPSRRRGETGAVACSTSVETRLHVRDKAVKLQSQPNCFKPSTSQKNCSCAHRYSGSSGAVLFGPEFGPPVWRMSVLASTTRLHLCHESRYQGEVQDPGEWGKTQWVKGKLLLFATGWGHECVPAGQRVWGLDHCVLLLPFGCVSDDKRDEAPDEDSNLSCGHDPPMFLKTQQEEDKATFEEGQLRYQACPATLGKGQNLQCCFFCFVLFCLGRAN